MRHACVTLVFGSRFFGEESDDACYNAGRLPPAGTEVTTFEHACGNPPCCLTQLHCPTAGPAGWELAIVRVYVDGEATASINVTLLELAGDHLDLLCGVGV